MGTEVPDKEPEGGELGLSGPALALLMQAVLERGVPFRFRAGGTSMSPFIRDGDVLTIAPARLADTGPGDVVAFTRPGREALVVHRLLKRSEDQFSTRGDNAGEDDGVFEAARLLGQVVRVERGGRRVAIGMGLERHAIALLALKNALRPALLTLAKLKRLFKSASRRAPLSDRPS